MRKLYTYIILIGLFMINASYGLDADGIPENRVKTIDELVKDAHQGVEYISSEKMKERIKQNKKLILIDVRTKREFDAGHIKGASWIERGIVEFVLVRTLPDPKAEIVVYCKVGNRTGLAVKALKKAGYQNVVGLEGGFDGWVAQGNTYHNFLGESRLVKPDKITAASFAVDFYEDKE